MIYTLIESLHWREFERLAHFYLKEKIGEGTWSTDGSKDGGRDASFKGRANEYPSTTAPWNGNWIFQVKHRTTHSKSSVQVEKELLRTLPTELKKIFIKHKFECDHYIYITNLNVSNSFRSKAESRFVTFFQRNCAARKSANFAVIEFKDLEPFIEKNSYIKRTFPGLLAFTDLEKIFLEKEETKNKGYIRSARKNIARFVSTRHYEQCVELLNNSHFLMLVGDTASGKTTIVQSLAIAFLEEGSFKPYFIRNTDEFFGIASYLKPEEKALFICDDIFGRHELEPTKQQDWTDYFESVMGSVHKNHRFVFTTRKYIFNEFLHKSRLGSLFPNETDPERYVVKLKDLDPGEREQILDKHLDQSQLRDEIVAAALQAKREILSCKDFSPEVIRSLIPQLRRAALSQVAEVISKHILNPNQYLFEFFELISQEKKLLLLSVAVAPNNDTSKVESRFLRLLTECHINPTILFSTFIDQLDGSIILKREYSDSSEVEYYHPSMYDVMIGIGGRDKRYRDLMLRNLNLELLAFLTLRPEPNRLNAIQMASSDFSEFEQGVSKFLLNDATLRDAASVVHWVTSKLSTDLSFNISFQNFVVRAKEVIASILATKDFFIANENEPIDHWVNLFDKWKSIPGKRAIAYREELMRFHWSNSSKGKYFRLLFAMEAVSPGLVEKHYHTPRFKVFASVLQDRVEGLKKGLNITSEGKLKTYEEWLGTFYLVNDLITKMKLSDAGRKIINGQILDNWQQIKLHSEKAKNRHAGMIRIGQWRTTPSIKGIGSDELWDSLL